MWVDQATTISDMYLGIIVNVESINMGSLLGVWAKPMIHFILLQW